MAGGTRSRQMISHTRNGQKGDKPHHSPEVTNVNVRIECPLPKSPFIFRIKCWNKCDYPNPLFPWLHDADFFLLFSPLSTAIALAISAMAMVIAISMAIAIVMLKPIPLLNDSSVVTDYPNLFITLLNFQYSR